MNSNAPQNSEPWIDPDDAPELTDADLRRGVWSINGKIVSEAEGRAAFALRLKAIDEAKSHASSNEDREKPASGS